MCRRSVERIEVVPGELGLGTGGYLISERNEDVNDFVDCLLEKMQPTAFEHDRFQGDIDPVVF
jgi:hypothetical protein